MSPAAVTTITKIASLSTRVTGDFEDHAFLPLLSGGERMSSGVGELLSIIAPDGQRLASVSGTLLPCGHSVPSNAGYVLPHLNSWQC